MNWFLFCASAFVLWWLVLFVMLPIGLRTQDEDEEVTLGTTSSAPSYPRLLRTIAVTTLVTAVLMGGAYVVIMVFGYSLDDLPRFAPALE